MATRPAQRGLGNAVAGKAVGMTLDATRDTSVVICAYTEERWHDLVAAVESIQRQSVLPREIIVVIDHNTPLFECAQAHLSGVTVIESSQPKGLSGARNSGIAVSQGSLITFLDDDAIAEPDWLERLGGCCQDPRVLGAGGVVKPLWSGERPTWFPDEFYWVVGCTYQHLPDKSTAVRNLFGGCTCIRRGVFETVGGFRNGLGRVGTRPLGGEETELCIRAKQYWPEKFFLCEPQAIIHHRIPSHRINWCYFRSRCYAEGLSKAAVTRYVGVKDGLASERAYTLRTLPQGMVQGVKDGLFRRDLAGFLRAGAIAVGLMMAIAGYVVGTISHFVMPSKGASTNIHHNFKQSLCRNDQERDLTESLSNG